MGFELAKLAIFLAQFDFVPYGDTPKFFRISVAAELARRLRQDGLKHPRHPDCVGIPEMLKPLWLKSPFAAKNASFAFERAKIAIEFRPRGQNWGVMDQGPS